MMQNEKSGSVTGAMGVQDFKKRDNMTRVKGGQETGLFIHMWGGNASTISSSMFKIKPKVATHSNLVSLILTLVSVEARQQS